MTQSRIKKDAAHKAMLVSLSVVLVVAEGTAQIYWL